jgi:hypothetical protein
MPEHNPYAPPLAEVADVATGEAAPALWNPNAASSWSLLFSPIFGAYLHMKNWQALGQPDKAEQCRKWVVGLVAFFVLATLAPVVIKNVAIVDRLGRIGGFALLITWYYSIGKSQQAYVFGRFGKTYPRRGWTVPLLVAVGIFAALIAVVAVFALMLGAV